jgi:predicted DNA-binding transcriptional regulator AlpA
LPRFFDFFGGAIMGSNPINCDQLAAADCALMGRNPINCEADDYNHVGTFCRCKLSDLHPSSGRFFSADFYHVDDLVSLLGVSRSQIDRACREYRVSHGKTGLPHCKLGRGFLFRRAAVDGWIKSMELSNHA